MANNAVSLSELLHALSQSVRERFPSYYWVRAEISEGRQNSSGHYYCRFIEKDDAGRDIAAVNGIIWYDTFRVLRQRFERETRQTLCAGIKVLVRVKVNFNERYGLSLIVYDIDPSYTLGDMVRRRKQILAQLEADGVINMNRELTLPRPLLRIAVISSSTAAGFGDFMTQLAAHGAAYRFRVQLFPAIMQGDSVESSVIAALNRIAQESEEWDAVTIMRGGGAVSDLNGFESYPLAANVAQFPLPVITGIGHERDETVIDLVANVHLKTPTAVADFLVERADHEMESLTQCMETLCKRTATIITGEQHRLALITAGLGKSRMIVSSEKSRLISDIKDTRSAFALAISGARTQIRDIVSGLPRAVSNVCYAQRMLQMRLSISLNNSTHGLVNSERTRLARVGERLRAGSANIVSGGRNAFDFKIVRLRGAVSTMLQLEKQKLASTDKSLKFAGPERIFRLGFSLTLKDGRAVRDAASLRAGDVITTRFEKGEVKSRVEAKTNNEEQNT